MKTVMKDLSGVSMGDLTYRTWESCSLEMVNSEEYKGDVYSSLGRDDSGVLLPYVMTMEIRGGDLFGVDKGDGRMRYILRVYVFEHKLYMVEWLNRYGIDRCLEVCWGEY